MSANPAERATMPIVTANGTARALVLAPPERGLGLMPVDAVSLAQPNEVALGRKSLYALIAAGLGLAVLLAGFILLYANFPDDYQALYGLSLDSPALFRTLWPYPAFSLDSATFASLAVLAIVSIWGVYLAAWAIVRGCQPAATRRQLAFIVAGAAVLFHLALTLFMPPILSTDIYHYTLFGRMVAFYGLNPYVVPDLAIRADPLWVYAGWNDVTTHYGPLFTLISAGAAAVSSPSILLTVLTFKAVVALFNLANCLLVFLLARRLGSGNGLGALLLYAWNPLILIETAGSGHNDTVMMTFALLGLLLATSGRLLLGLAALVLSVLVKYLSAILLVFFVVRCLAIQTTRRSAAALAARMGAVAALLTIVFFLPFWAGPQGFERLVNVGSPFKTAVRIVLRGWVTNLLANGGDGGQVRALAELYIIVGLHLAFAALMLLLIRTILIRKPGWPRLIELWGMASLVYLIVVYGWNLPWFLVIPLATTCAVLQSRLSYRLLAACHGFGLALMLPYAMLIR
jgi:hypothetical protein